VVSLNDFLELVFHQHVSHVFTPQADVFTPISAPLHV